MYVCTVFIISEWIIPQDNCSHFLCNCWKSKAKTFNSSLAQYYFEIVLVNFRGFIVKFGMICSLQRLLPVILSLVKNKSPAAGCLSTYDSSICTINQTVTWVKSREWDCQAIHMQPKFVYHHHHTKSTSCCIYIAFPAISLFLCTQTAAWLFVFVSAALLLILSLPATSNIYIVVS